ncbi:MAG: hypothetical protein HY077_15745 [Elusimicrobia bacterium]|nr:hypothetical protein [Elusimicrobiota bacterium]
MKKRNGQVLALVLIILMIMMTLVPLMVFYVQRESVWTAKQAETTRAFHMSEAGIEKGYLEISLSTQTWVTLMLGGANAPLTNYKFDKEFTDVEGGTYTISITSGPLSQQATIIAIGRDNLKKEVRGIKAVYSNAPMTGNAIFGVAGVDMGGKVNVEWGSIISPSAITPLYQTNSAYTWPSLYSAGAVYGLDTDPNPPNADGSNCWWHSYQTTIPPSPVIDLNYYASQAKAAKASTYSCPAGALASDCTSGTANDCCYYRTDPNFDGSQMTGGATIYVNTGINIGSAHGAYFEGSMVIMGNLTTSAGNFGYGPHNYTMKMPAMAWQQYCEPALAWPHYTSTFDSAAPATFPGLNSTSYTSPSACSSTKNCQSSQLFSNGMLYVTGYMAQGGGGGGTDFYGVMYVLGTTTMTASSQNSTFYYSDDAAKGLQLTQVILARQSWQDVVVKKWGTPPQ